VVGREINAEAEGNAKKTQNEKRKRRKKQTTFKLVWGSLMGHPPGNEEEIKK